MKRQRRHKLEHEMQKIASKMIYFSKTWEFNGQDTEKNRQWMILSSRIHHNSGVQIIFTRDSDHHLSGWLRNPDYERCWHLSLSPIPSWLIIPGRTVELDREITRMWCDAFFGPHFRLAWAEGSKSEIGKQAGVWHWRVFADEKWEPILPRGEVYSSRWTELGWKSASEIFELTCRPEPISTVDPT